MQGRPFIRKGKTLLSGIDPARRGEQIANAVSVKDRTLYLCPSPLYGYGLQRLLSRIEKEAPDSAVLCVEAEPELYELSLKNIDPSPAAAGKLRITNISESGALCAFVRQAWGARNFRRLEQIRLSGGWQLYPDLYNSLADALRREIAVDWSNALILTKLGRLYTRNMLRNLALIPTCSSIEHLSFGEDPVLVLGAGPSLDETLAGLDRVFGEKLQMPQTRPFRIICADTCLPVLHEMNIVPDLAVILESQHWNLGDFIGCRGWNVIAAMDLSALPASGRVLGGETYLFSTEWTELSIFKRLKEAGLLPMSIPPLGSVGLCAVELARLLGRGKIITAGIDFSFTLDKYHARCTPGHKSRMASQSRFDSILNAAAAFAPAAFSVISKSGLSVHSSPAMRNYRSLFEQEYSAEKRLFCITDSGLPLGIQCLSPEDAYKALAPMETAAAAGVTGKEQAVNSKALNEKLKLFLHEEKNRLMQLKKILCGEEPDHGPLNTLIDECDYLWSHFPDYAGGRRPDEADISFLKRLRTEIDPALALLDRTINRLLF
ncbi:MAG: DUF115 domain-containing protein [Treponema sp.]|nr:DUF115 domain-containing protein [Treponema sp.]